MLGLQSSLDPQQLLNKSLVLQQWFGLLNDVSLALVHSSHCAAKLSPGPQSLSQLRGPRVSRLRCDWSIVINTEM